MIVAVEGIDGSGKSLHFDILEKYLNEQGRASIQISFPRYETFVGREIGQMLSGKTEVRADLVDARSMALWYAVDRYNCFRNNDFSGYDYVLFNRYTLANAVYQSLRVPEIEREDFVNWVFELEHGEFKLPVPDCYIILDVDTEASKINVSKKGHRDYIGEEADVYEKNSTLMANARDMYLSLAKSIVNAKVISCMDESGNLLPPMEIHLKIREALSSYE